MSNCDPNKPEGPMFNPIRVQRGEVKRTESGKFYAVFKGGRIIVLDGGWAQVRRGGEAMVFDGGFALAFEGARIIVRFGGKAEVFAGGCVEVRSGGKAKVLDGSMAVVYEGGIAYVTSEAKAIKQGGRVEKWDGFSPIPGFDEELTEEEQADQNEIYQAIELLMAEKALEEALVSGTDAPATEDERTDQKKQDQGNSSRKKIWTKKTSGPVLIAAMVGNPNQTIRDLHIKTGMSIGFISQRKEWKIYKKAKNEGVEVSHEIFEVSSDEVIDTGLKPDEAAERREAIEAAVKDQKRDNWKDTHNIPQKSV
jgi:hypothetical protein